MNRSSAWACEAVAGVERAIRALLSPPRRPCTARTAFNLATTRRCCVAVRAIVKPYVLGRTRKTQGSTRTFWPGTLVSLRMCHIRRRPRRPLWISIAFFHMGFAAQNPTWGFYTGINYCEFLLRTVTRPIFHMGFPTFSSERHSVVLLRQAAGCRCCSSQSAAAAAAVLLLQ